jgi:hypothetical protein
MWIHHGEMVVINVNPQEDVETLDYLDQYVAKLDAQMDDNDSEKGGDAGGWDGDDEGGANNDGGGRVRDEDDGNCLEEMLQAIGPEILLKSAKGLKKLDRVKKASKESWYGVEKGCPTHWTVLCFVLELLILKAKYVWSDCSFQ